jgi:hypothetical protein
MVSRDVGSAACAVRPHSRTPAETLHSPGVRVAELVGASIVRVLREPAFVAGLELACESVLPPVVHPVRDNPGCAAADDRPRPPANLRVCQGAFRRVTVLVRLIQCGGVHPCRSGGQDAGRHFGGFPRVRGHRAKQAHDPERCSSL